MHHFVLSAQELSTDQLLCPLLETAFAIVFAQKSLLRSFSFSLSSITCSSHDGVSVFVNKYTKHTFWHIFVASCLKEHVALLLTLNNTVPDSDNDSRGILDH